MDKGKFTLAITAAGFGGTLLDSLLGAIFQASVIDLHSGKIIEGEGGRKVLVHGSHPVHQKASAKVRSGAVSHEEGKDGIVRSTGVTGSAEARKRQQGAGSTEHVEGKHESRKVEVGWDILDNNAVNLLMASQISCWAMIAACLIWGLPFRSAIPFDLPK